MRGEKVDLTQKRKCHGGIDEATSSKTHGPTQTYKLDDTTSDAKSNRTSALSTRNCIRENKALGCIKAEQDTREHMIQMLENLEIQVSCKIHSGKEYRS